MGLSTHVLDTARGCPAEGIRIALYRVSGNSHRVIAEDDLVVVHATYRNAPFSEAEALVAFDWPGNVRQLRSAVERACVVARQSEIDAVDLPPEVLRTDGATGDDPSLVHCTWAQALERGRADVGKKYLEALMRRFDGQVAEAAAQAGVERESFYRLLRKHGVDAAAFRHWASQK